MKFKIEWQSWYHYPETLVVEGIRNETCFSVEAESFEEALKRAGEEANRVCQNRLGEDIKRWAPVPVHCISVPFPHIISLTDEMGNFKQIESQKKISGAICDAIVDDIQPTTRRR